MCSIGQLVGSLAIAFIITRVFYFAQRKLSPDLNRSNAIIFAYIFFLFFATVAGGYGFSHDEQPVFAQAFIQYLPAAVIFLIFDLYKSKSSTEPIDPLVEKAVQIQPVTNVMTTENLTISENATTAEKATTVEKNFCSKCGDKLQNAAKFCSGCGTVV